MQKKILQQKKYASLLELLEKQGCTDVKNLNVAKNATYSSHPIAEELQQAVADTIMSDVIADLKDSLCLAILTDESTDISVSGKLDHNLC